MDTAPGTKHTSRRLHSVQAFLLNTISASECMILQYTKWSSSVIASRQDVTLAIGAKALLWPSESVLHVATGQGSPIDVFSRSDGVEIPATDEALAQILAFVETGAASDVPLGPGLYGVSAFYEGRGAYHLFQTCNSWVSQALRAGHISAAPGFGVLSSTLVWDLKRWYD